MHGGISREQIKGGFSSKRITKEIPWKTPDSPGGISKKKITGSKNS